MPLDFSGKTALAAGGADVWIFDLERVRPQQAAQSLGGQGCHVDVTDRSTIDAAFAQSGPPDIVVANAGVGVWAPIDQTTADAWDRTVAVNLGGVFHTVQAAARLMKPRRRGA